MKYKLATLLFIFAMNSSALPYDPPKGLRWGMTYEEMKQVLKNPDKGDKVKVKKLGKPARKNSYYFFPDRSILENYKVCNLEKIKLLYKKLTYAIAVFDDSTGLTLLQYNFTFIVEKKEKNIGDAWAYYQKLYGALSKKYGIPSTNQIVHSDIGKRLAVGVNLRTTWSDSTLGDEICLIVCCRQISSLVRIKKHEVILEYASRPWLMKETERLLDTDL